MAAKLDDATASYAVELYMSGSSGPAVAIRLGIDATTVLACVRRAGQPVRSIQQARQLYHPRGKNLRTDIDGRAVAVRFLGGQSVKSLAQDLHVSGRLITRLLRDEGVATRTPAEARLLIDREQATTRGAVSRSRMVGLGEQTLQAMLEERGEHPDPQAPVGTRNIDLAIPPVAVEVWLSSTSPLGDPYCLRRFEYLRERGWWLCYVLVSRRTGLLIPTAAEQVIALANLARTNPTPLREHWVIRGCGELAARFTDQDNHPTLIPPAHDCPHHSTINKRFAR